MQKKIKLKQSIKKAKGLGRQKNSYQIHNLIFTYKLIFNHR